MVIKNATDNIKPVAAIHDLSGFGRCSLTVIIPSLSALGVQCCPIPTAVFSTHTGGLGDVVKRDLTDFIRPTLTHYKTLDLEFSGIYTGYLSSEHQVDNCLEFFDAYPDALHIVDPVMGDHGKIYSAYTPRMQERMKELVARAHVITPNLTEACLLTGREFTEAPLDTYELKKILIELSKYGPRHVIITGLSVEGCPKLVNAGYDSKTEKVYLVSVDRVPAAYPGTGDLFASIITGEMVKGKDFEQAMITATAFTELAVSITYKNGSDTRFGVMLEPVLASLAIGVDCSSVEHTTV